MALCENEGEGYKEKMHSILVHTHIHNVHSIRKWIPISSRDVQEVSVYTGKGVGRENGKCTWINLLCEIDCRCPY